MRLLMSPWWWLMDRICYRRNHKFASAWSQHCTRCRRFVP
jgi:hypothetical protein